VAARPLQKKRNLEKPPSGGFFYVRTMKPGECRRRAATLAATLLLAACASLPEGARAPDIADSPWAQTSAGHPGPIDHRWAHYALPGKVASRFEYQRVDGRDTIAVQAASSASMLRRKVRMEPDTLGQLQFSWKVPALIEHADLTTRDKDDSAVRLVLVFDGDRSRFSARDAALADLVFAVTGEEMPYATLMYVWCNKRAAGSVITSPRTGRIRKLCLESGPAALDRWLDYDRDVRADYERAFGEQPGALVGVALMTDSDNTRSRVRAWYGPVRFAPLR
jgi:hypothetical protein